MSQSSSTPTLDVLPYVASDTVSFKLLNADNPVLSHVLLAYTQLIICIAVFCAVPIYVILITQRKLRIPIHLPYILLACMGSVVALGSLMSQWFVPLTLLLYLAARWTSAPYVVFINGLVILSTIERILDIILNFKRYYTSMITPAMHLITFSVLGFQICALSIIVFAFLFFDFKFKLRKQFRLSYIALAIAMSVGITTAIQLTHRLITSHPTPLFATYIDSFFGMYYTMEWYYDLILLIITAIIIYGLYATGAMSKSSSVESDDTVPLVESNEIWSRVNVSNNDKVSSPGTSVSGVI